MYFIVFQPQIDLNSMKDFKNPEEFLKLSKKGKSLMIFVKVKLERYFNEIDLVLFPKSCQLQKFRSVANRPEQKLKSLPLCGKLVSGIIMFKWTDFFLRITEQFSCLK